VSGPVLNDYDLGALGGEALSLLQINGLGGSFKITQEQFIDSFFPPIYIGGRVRGREVALPRSKTPGDVRPSKQEAATPPSTRVR
jgi:hypothetical protein